MEKKTKKLQLRKETIAVLNGEHMTHVVGGTGIEPNPNDTTGYLHNTVPLKCPDGFGFNPVVQQCVPVTVVIATIIIITTSPKPAY